MTPDETGYAYKFEQQKFMCNVGSVGQPRRWATRVLAMVIQEPTQLTFRRVEYDPTITAEKIYNISGPRRFPGRPD